MSRSPCYSPDFNIMDPNRTSSLNNDSEGINLQNMMDDINDPITHPFNFAQDRESWYAEVAAAAQEEYRLEKAKRQTLKKRKVKSKSLKTKSFIMRKESDRAQRVIKIIIYDLDGGNMDEISSNPEDASVNVQYLVTSEYDDIMTETEYLVGKIVKKLSK
ncbi:uncharacterized protein LOC135118185 [Helicoverpa armigera]|uniref:uncharacterized protein LOC135118185 n=1 Tax=Helicoverpa armigera TaxID=29058 RepID=UPI0030836D89